VIHCSGAVLLFQYEDAGPRWGRSTSGDALERDETFEEAALRKGDEELAISSSRSSCPCGGDRPVFIPRHSCPPRRALFLALDRAGRSGSRTRSARGSPSLGHPRGAVVVSRKHRDDLRTSLPEDVAQHLRELRFEVTPTDGPMNQDRDECCRPFDAPPRPSPSIQRRNQRPVPIGATFR
jgi:hypothetical protein